MISFWPDINVITGGQSWGVWHTAGTVCLRCIYVYGAVCVCVSDVSLIWGACRLGPGHAVACWETRLSSAWPLVAFWKYRPMPYDIQCLSLIRLCLLGAVFFHTPFLLPALAAYTARCSWKGPVFSLEPKLWLHTCYHRPVGEISLHSQSCFWFDSDRKKKKLMLHVLYGLLSLGAKS